MERAVLAWVDLAERRADDGDRVATGVDRSRVGFQFAKQPPQERVVNTFVSNRNLRIPAGAGGHPVLAKVTLQADSTLLAMFPHMHVRGKAFEYRATYPNGESETLLSVPKYNFNWQLTYYLQHPKVLPKGTVLECVALYDNSPNNPFNPDPNSEIYWGDQTWDEMLAGFVDLAMPVKMDPMSLVPPKPKPAVTPKRREETATARSEERSRIDARPSSRWIRLMMMTSPSARPRPWCDGPRILGRIQFDSGGNRRPTGQSPGPLTRPPFNRL